MGNGLDRIEIAGIPCMAHVGVPEKERSRAQKVVLDVVLELSLEAACNTDRLDLTVDYGEVVEEVRCRVEAGHFVLLERLAEEACQAALSDSRVQRATVKAKKFPRSLAGLVDHVAVQLTREYRHG
ncbi:MAG TPA: dihydroneopterin aldolase [Acidobacteriota bacterium]|nr:dihydroneopterin aldolase [Acidobacteriota bacterium]